MVELPNCSSPIALAPLNIVPSAPTMAARIEAPVRSKELSNQGRKNASDCESSDEDDDGIPRRVKIISPSKHMAVPPLQLASTRPNLKRSFQTFKHDRRASYPDTHNDLVFYPGLSKKRNVDNWADIRGPRILPTPASSHPAHTVKDAPFQHESAGSSAEDEVPENVIYFVNSALHPRPQGGPEQHRRQKLSSPSHQPPSELSQEGEYADNINIVNGEEEQEWEQEEEVENPSHATESQYPSLRKTENGRETKDLSGEARDQDGANFATAGSIEYLPHLNGSINKEITLEANPEGGRQDLGANPDEVSGSSEEPKQPEEPNTGTQAHIGRRHAQSIQQSPPPGDEVKESSKPLRRSHRIQSATGRSQQAPRLHVPDHPPKTKPGDGDYCAETIDGLEADEEEEADIDLSAGESFEQDVKRFRSFHVTGTDNVKHFEGPPDDDLIAIHLDYQPLRRACKLMTYNAWTGRKVDWQWRPFTCDDAVTLPGRTILSLLVKLERLYDAAPTAPKLPERNRSLRKSKLMEQNRFLREHSDLLNYYLAKIELVVDHIRTERLASLKRNTSTLNTDNEKRKEMAQELIYLIIPMLLHVLASAWRLGGGNLDQTLFTSSTTELLKRVVHWIRSLCRPLLGELRRSPLKEEPSSVSEKNKWHKKNARREELNDIMEPLLRVMQDAPDRLEEEENRVVRELSDHRRELRKRKEKEAQRKREEEAKLRSIEEQRVRSLMSIRGVYYPLGSSPLPSSPERLPASSASSSYRPPQWSFEEKVFLFKKIQESYPIMPNLKILRLEVGKTVNEMENMAEELLEIMLEAVEPEETAESRSAEVQEIMEGYRLAYRH
ncbi:hypothetical protein F5X99DRAFT_399538 [Biscogniauxia marginata]|nr:hypothetical protein F5X99DRAFT_399538 [Biscogniauxia marginata]